jgi:hypothetical protein
MFCLLGIQWRRCGAEDGDFVVAAFRDVAGADETDLLVRRRAGVVEGDGDERLVYGGLMGEGKAGFSENKYRSGRSCCMRCILRDHERSSVSSAYVLPGNFVFQRNSESAPRTGRPMVESEARALVETGVKMDCVALRFLDVGCFWGDGSWILI